MTTDMPSAPAGSAVPSERPAPVVKASEDAASAVKASDDGAPAWTLLPVTLQFTGVTPNSSLNFTFTTVGASWSLGAFSGDSVGFSYNVAPASADSASCIQQIEFNNAVLTIRTGNTGQSSSQTSYAFTLTLFLRVRPGVDYVQGYCTLNNEAVVIATIGTQGPVKWRNGRISAVLATHGFRYRPVSVTVKGARPGNKIDVIVSTKTGLGRVVWSLGPEFVESNGVLLASQQGLLPLSSLSYGTDTLSFITSMPDNAGNTYGSSEQPLEIYLNAYITWLPVDLNYVYLRTTCDNSISVLAQVNSRQPQLVSQTNTVFTLG